ncbi:MAG: DUF1553 domain-containing protein [Fuerstiella sp.]
MKLVCLSKSLLLISCLLAARNTVAADDRAEFFEARIRPVLIKHCYSCHSAEAKHIRGGLLLDSATGIADGGESGAVLESEIPDDSLLISSMKHESYEMPPAGKLSDEIIADFEKWIADGAYDPRQGGERVERRVIDLEEGRKFWSFQPIQTPQIPAGNFTWAQTAIDKFVEVSHHENKVSAAADADSLEIFRRLSFALTGLPPTLKQIKAFQKDNLQNSQAALEKWTDRWLESRRFGERWGRHWLDVARFSESSGGGRSLLFPHSWRFRDYVIQSFQNDKPLPQLIKEHVAGDLLSATSKQQKDEQLVGSGYLILGPNNYEQQDKELLRMDVIDEQISTVGRTFLGMTLGCVRCHDHKFDPIPATDYYALAGIFRSTQSLTFGNVSGYVTTSLKAAPEAAFFDQWQVHLAELKAELSDLSSGMKQKKIVNYRSQVSSESLPGIVIDDRQADFEGQWVPSTHVKVHVDLGYQHNDNRQTNQKVSFKADLPNAGKYEVRLAWTPGPTRCAKVPVQIHHADGKTIVEVDQRERPTDGLFSSLGRYRFKPNQQAIVTVAPVAKTSGYVIADAVQFLSAADFPNRSVVTDPERLKQDRLKQQVQNLTKQIASWQKQKPEQPIAMAVKDRAKSADWHLHVRGEIRNLGELVPRGALSVASAVDSTGKTNPFQIPDGSSGRRQLADWIADEGNPLTRRVYVNRIWQHLMGEGIVRTPDNFGMTGQRPTHPELLDYLASTFVTEDEWSTKSLIRRIVLSRTFRLSSAVTESQVAADPDNQLLTRGFRQRIDAEALRDAMLRISDELDLTVKGGRTIQKVTTYDNDYRHRKYPTMARSVFVPSFRNAPLPFLATFDGVNSNMVSGDRSESILPSQALYLMNSDFVMERSLKAAQQWSRQTASSQLNQKSITDIYLMTLGRLPTVDEITLVQSFLNQNNDRQQALSAVYQSLFASIDFRYLD